MKSEVQTNWKETFVVVMHPFTETNSIITSHKILPFHKILYSLLDFIKVDDNGHDDMTTTINRPPSS